MLTLKPLGWTSHSFIDRPLGQSAALGENRVLGITAATIAQTFPSLQRALQQEFEAPADPAWNDFDGSGTSDSATSDDRMPPDPGSSRSETQHRSLDPTSTSAQPPLYPASEPQPESPEHPAAPHAFELLHPQIARQPLGADGPLGHHEPLPIEPTGAPPFDATPTPSIESPQLSDSRTAALSPTQPPDPVPPLVSEPEIAQSNALLQPNATPPAQPDEAADHALMMTSQEEPAISTRPDPLTDRSSDLAAPDPMPTGLAESLEQPEFPPAPSSADATPILPAPLPTSSSTPPIDQATSPNSPTAPESLSQLNADNLPSSASVNPLQPSADMEPLILRTEIDPPSLDPSELSQPDQSQQPLAESASTSSEPPDQPVTDASSIAPHETTATPLSTIPPSAADLPAHAADQHPALSNFVEATDATQFPEPVATDRSRPASPPEPSASVAIDRSPLSDPPLPFPVEATTANPTINPIPEARSTAVDLQTATDPSATTPPASQPLGQPSEATAHIHLEEQIQKRIDRSTASTEQSVAEAEILDETTPTIDSRSEAESITPDIDKSVPQPDRLFASLPQPAAGMPADDAVPASPFSPPILSDDLIHSDPAPAADSPEIQTQPVDLQTPTLPQTSAIELLPTSQPAETTGPTPLETNLTLESYDQVQRDRFSESRSPFTQAANPIQTPIDPDSAKPSSSDRTNQAVTIEPDQAVDQPPSLSQSSTALQTQTEDSLSQPNIESTNTLINIQDTSQASIDLPERGNRTESDLPAVQASSSLDDPQPFIHPDTESVPAFTVEPTPSISSESQQPLPEAVSQRFTAQDRTQSSRSQPASQPIPESWSSLSELISPDYGLDAEVDPWQDTVDSLDAIAQPAPQSTLQRELQPELQPDRSSGSESSPFLENATATDSSDQTTIHHTIIQARADPSSPDAAFPLDTSQSADSPRSQAPTDEQFDQLARLIYSQLRQRLAIDRERWEPSLSEYPLWLGETVLSEVKGTSDRGLPNQKPPNINTAPTLPDAAMRKLTAEIYRLLKLRVELDQERHALYR